MQWNGQLLLVIRRQSLVRLNYGIIKWVFTKALRVTSA